MSISPINYQIENNGISFRSIKQAERFMQDLSKNKYSINKKAEMTYEKLERYVETHPKDISARKKLSELRTVLGY